MLEDRVVEFVSCGPDGLRDDDATHRDDGHFGRAAAEVDDHRSCRVLDRQVGTDGSSHRLLDQIRLAGTCRDCCLEDSTLLDGRDTRRHADNDAGTRRPGILALARLLNEVAQHDLSDIEVSNDAVLQRTLGDDRSRRTANHALCIGADGKDALLLLVDCDDGRLVQDDALATDRDKRICGAKIDGKVSAILTKYGVDKGHVFLSLIFPMSNSAEDASKNCSRRNHSSAGARRPSSQCRRGRA